MKKLELIYPINDPIITQVFGVNGQFYSDPKYGGISGHNGIDFLTYHGQPVYATHDGYASYQVDASSGHGIVIYSKEVYPYMGEDVYFKSIYWHLCDPVKEPKYASKIATGGLVEVSTGDLIGYADNTGASTGDHLHFGLKPCTKDENKMIWYNTEQKNGYNGAIDPMPYFDKFTPVQFDLLKKQVTVLTKVVDLLKQLLTLKSK